MIGWIPHVLVGFLDEVAGPEVRTLILNDAGLDGHAAKFRFDTDLPDPACRRVIEATCQRLGMTEQRVCGLFAPYFLATARVAFPGFFRGVANTAQFLLRQPAIHNSLATGLRDPRRTALADKFSVSPVREGIRVRYNSPNRLAHLYVELAKALAVSFNETADVIFEAGGPDDTACTMLVMISPDGPRETGPVAFDSRVVQPAETGV